MVVYIYICYNALTHSDDGVAFAWTQPADELHQALCVQVRDGSVDVHAHLIDPVDELLMQRFL